ncbi:hypothetical protein PAXRUDRAFT_562674 [Paxillus rubicundulus Ve08.2h10]|uniref:Uncharacterized protein n=1 Tax=Paxillus rubicundulus Ve08.2h10 TaxID=930991 RepID=A0A0D0DM62_9AGAM|nr:hypothetical protein PAXRUDRAFT_562674 [Paxillus rubicundulus Ve08.2h10]
MLLGSDLFDHQIKCSFLSMLSLMSGCVFCGEPFSFCLMLLIGHSLFVMLNCNMELSKPLFCLIVNIRDIGFPVWLGQDAFLELLSKS